MTQIPVSPGIDGIPTTSIPTDPQAFVTWFKSVYLKRWAANGDARNAIPGVGVQISGQLNTPAFIGFDDIAGLSVLGNPTGTAGDVENIVAAADGEYLQREGGALAFAPLAVVTADSVAGAGTTLAPVQLVNDLLAPGTTQYYGTDAGGNKGYHPVPSAAGSSITVLVQSGGISQVYNVPATAKVVEVICIGGGGGGGSGGRNTNGAAVSGGGVGGAGGGISRAIFNASLLGASVTVAFSNATGGAGGNPQTTVANGNGGTAGSNVAFGNFLIATGGGGGGGGATSSPGATTGGLGVWQSGTAGATGGTTAGGANGSAQASTTLALTAYGNTGGGGGGGVNAGGTAFAGGTGGGGSQFMTLTAALGGTLGGNAGGQGAPGNGLMPAGGGGGGGGGGGTINGGAGGQGGAFGGGGGGGGGGNSTATQSGAGGQGGAAACIIIAY